MKNLIKVDYFCPEVSKEGIWLVLETEEKPELGIIKNPADYLLPHHNCRKDIYSQACDEDITCNWQRIFEIKPFSEQEAKTLNAKPLSARVLHS